MGTVRSHAVTSPIGMMATAQVCAAIPNFLAQERHWIDSPDLWRNWVKEGEIIQNGFITLPDRPGIGVEMNDDGARKAQVPRHVLARIHEERMTMRLSTVYLAALCAASAFAQPGVLTKDLLIQYTPDWKANASRTAASAARTHGPSTCYSPAMSTSATTSA